MHQTVLTPERGNRNQDRDRHPVSKRTGKCVAVNVIVLS